MTRELAEKARTRRRRRLVNLALVAATAGLVGAGLLAGKLTGGSAQFAGTDTTATTAIERSHPEYRRWLEPLLPANSAEVESGLFAMQAALGAGVFGYLLGVLRERGRQARQNAAPARQEPGQAGSESER